MLGNYLMISFQLNMASIKEKVNAIRNVVTGYSNHEIVLVLQHYDEDVDLAIADFMFPEKIKAILTEWQSTGPMKTKKKKKKKNKKPKQESDSINREIEEVLNAGDQSSHSEKLVNGDQTNGSDVTATALKMLLTDPQRMKSLVTNDRGSSNHIDVQQASRKTKEVTNGDLKSVDDTIQHFHLRDEGRRIRTSSETSFQSNSHKRKNHRKPEIGNRNQHSNKGPQESTKYHSSNRKAIEKAVKDLQRCTVSFGRYRNLLNDEINESYKRIKQAFEELANAIMDREVVLFRNLDEIKEEAFLMLSKREARAAQLKQQTDRVDNMNPQQLSDLRNDIKQFVAERKFDEEIGRTTRFVCDKELSLKLIPEFGEISTNKNLPSLISRIRTESTVSHTSEVSIPPTPSPTIPVKQEKEEQKEKERERKGPIKKEKFEKKQQPSSNAMKLNLNQTKENQNFNSMVSPNWADESDHLVPLSPMPWANEPGKTVTDKPKESSQRSTNKHNYNRPNQHNRYPDNKEKKSWPKEDKQQKPKFKTNQLKWQPEEKQNHYNSNADPQTQRNNPKKGFGRGSGDSTRGGGGSYNRYRGNFRGGNRGGRGNYHTTNDNVAHNSSNNYRNNPSDGQQIRNKPRPQTASQNTTKTSSTA